MVYGRETRELKVGDIFRLRVAEDLTRTQLVMYAGASGDYHALHTDEVFATQVAGFPSVFAPGMLTMGMTGRVLTEVVGAANLRKFGVRFIGQVFPGDTLEAVAKVIRLFELDGERRAELEVFTVNQNGAEVVRGTAEASF